MFNKQRDRWKTQKDWKRQKMQTKLQTKCKPNANQVALNVTKTAIFAENHLLSEYLSFFNLLTALKNTLLQWLNKL